MPFFFEDGALIGKRADIAKLVSNEADALLRPHGTEDAQWIIHILRFIMPFLRDYPIFRRLIDEIDVFPQLYDYRFKTVELQIEQAFFWHLAVANAWVLHTSFHIDCGYVGQLKFYPNQFQEQKLHKPVEQFTSLDEMELYPPYGTVENWRVSQDPGGMLPCIGRAYGRLVDDNWPRSLFAGKPLRDLPLENMQIVLNNITQYRTGVLRELENQYYAAVAEGYRTHWLNRAA